MTRFTLTAAASAIALTAAFASAADDQRPRHGTMSEFFDLVEFACNRAPDDSTIERTFGRALTAGPRLDPEALLRLSRAMLETDPAAHEDDSIPAGIAFFGQLIDHDITLDVLSQLGEVAEPEELRNFRTPQLDLDSIYGSGPEVNPYLYDQERAGYLLVGPEGTDIMRNPQGVALIGDPRNDENGIIAQLQLLFIRFHNAVMHDVERGRFNRHRETTETDFEFARRIVEWHYQWIVRHEYLPTVVDAATIDAVEAHLRNGGDFCRAPLMPVEFSAAAYRFGHSQIRSRYKVGPGRPRVDFFAPPAKAIGSFEPVQPVNRVHWDFFFAVNESVPQRAQRIDPRLASELFELPFAGGDERNLAFRNLNRGANTFQLPSGECAREQLIAFGFDIPQLERHAAVREVGLSETPLWFYCLQEADELGDGRLIGVGGTLVASTLIRLLTDSEQQSFDKVEEIAVTRSKERDPHRAPWQPFLGTTVGRFTIADLVRYTRSVESTIH